MRITCESPQWGARSDGTLAGTCAVAAAMLLLELKESAAGGVMLTVRVEGLEPGSPLPDSVGSAAEVEIGGACWPVSQVLLSDGVYGLRGSASSPAAAALFAPPAGPAGREDPKPAAAPAAPDADPAFAAMDEFRRADEARAVNEQKAVAMRRRVRELEGSLEDAREDLAAAEARTEGLAAAAAVARRRAAAALGLG